MRTIKFLPDTGNVIKVQAENGINVGQFAELLLAKGGSLDLGKNMLTEKVSKATFLTSDAVLPDGDISLFSVIKDPKGNNTRAEVYAQIKELVSTYGERAKNHFNEFGNYTRTSTEDLLHLLKTFRKTKPSKKATPVKTTKTAAKSSDEQELRAARDAFKGKVYRG